MGKQKAQALAREEKLTWEQLLAIVNAGPSDDEACSINPSLTVGYCRALYRTIIADRLSEEKPKAWRPDVYSRRPGAVKPSKDFIIVTNILRIFHP